MSFASDLLKKVKVPSTVIEEVESQPVEVEEYTAPPEDRRRRYRPGEIVMTDRGPMRANQYGKVDGRQQMRGRRVDRRAIFIKKEYLRFKEDLLALAPGITFEWKWIDAVDDRTCAVQASAAHRIANANGVTIKVKRSLLGLEVKIIDMVKVNKDE